MSPLASPSGPRILGVLFLCWILAAAGCSGDKSGLGKVVPVSGQVTLGAQSLTAGTVTFIPDTSRGNTSRFHPFGLIGGDGKYRLIPAAHAGAPPGWYKVTFSPLMPPGRDVPPPGKQVTPKPVGVDPTYLRPDTTRLVVEVVDNPSAGAYDLKLH